MTNLSGVRVSLNGVGGIVWRKDPFNSNWQVVWDDGEKHPPTPEHFFTDGFEIPEDAFLVCPICGAWLRWNNSYVVCLDCVFSLPRKGIYHVHHHS